MIKMTIKYKVYQIRFNSNKIKIKINYRVIKYKNSKHLKMLNKELLKICYKNLIIKKIIKKMISLL